MRFQDMRIGLKMAIPMVVIGVIGLGAAVYGGLQFKKIEETYSSFVTERTTAILNNARATRSMTDLLGDIYKSLAHPNYMKEREASGAAAKRAYDNALNLLQAAKASFPAQAARYDEFSLQLIALKPQIDQAVAHALKDETVEALSVVSQLDRAISATMAAAARLNDEIKADTEASTVRLDAAAIQAILVSLGGAALGLLVGLGFGLWLLTRQVTGPLARLKSRMDDLTSGDYAVVIDGPGPRRGRGADPSDRSGPPCPRQGAGAPRRRAERGHGPARQWARPALQGRPDLSHRRRGRD